MVMTNSMRYMLLQLFKYCRDNKDRRFFYMLNKEKKLAIVLPEENATAISYMERHAGYTTRYCAYFEEYGTIKIACREKDDILILQQAWEEFMKSKKIIYKIPLYSVWKDTTVEDELKKAIKKFS